MSMSNVYRMLGSIAMTDARWPMRDGNAQVLEIVWIWIIIWMQKL